MAIDSGAVPDVGPPGADLGPIDSRPDWRLENFILDPDNRSVGRIDVAQSIASDPRIRLTTQGASEITVPIMDEHRAILGGDFLTGWAWGRNADDRDEAHWIKDGRHIDALLARTDSQGVPRTRSGFDWWFRLVRVEKQGDVLNLVFESREASKMRNLRGAFKDTRDASTTRIAFCARRAVAAGCRPFAPEAGIVQPQDVPQEITDANSIKTEDNAAGGGATGSSRGLPRRLTLKGWDNGTHTLNADERKNAEIACGVALREKASERATLALLCACIVEAPFFKNNVGGGASSKGVLQLIASTAAGLNVNPRDVEAVCALFLKRGFYGHGGAITNARQNPGKSVGQIAQETQGSAFPDRYQKVLPSAEKVLRAYAGGALADAGALLAQGTTEVVETKPFAFEQGANETAWDCDTRLMGEVNGRVFVRSGLVWIVSDTWLFQQKSQFRMREDRPGDDAVTGVSNVDFEMDIYARNLVATVTATVRVDRWTVLPGMVATLSQEMGAASGRWLVTEIERGFSDTEATVTLSKPVPLKNEPAPETTTRTVSLGVSLQGATRYPLAEHGDIIGVPYKGTHTLGNWQSDNAVDIAVPFGTVVLAVDGGTIVKTGGSGNFNGRFGGYNLTLVSANGRNAWYYAHLSKVTVHAGQKVQSGQSIGRSGKANGVEHLHFGQQHGDPRTRLSSG